MKKLLEKLSERWRVQYSSISHSDSEDEVDIQPLTSLRERKNEWLRFSLTILTVAFACLSTRFATGYFTNQFSIFGKFQNSLSHSCAEPVMRKEWRSLTDGERTEYVRAVKCLSTKPSKVGLRGTIYDDFGWLHRNVGQYSHHSSSFLPWHRYTLHIYEKTLKDECGFQGNLPYWDWSLDWRDLAISSIWDSESGFGGDGDAEGQITVGDGRCVTDGPFSDFKPIYFNHSYIPHCLSRGFRDGDTVGRLSGFNALPEAIGILLLRPTYDQFIEMVEHSVHDMVHNSVGGDFMAFTASNDPLFYLHHAQLDRLWWQWQRRKPKQRLTEYLGQHMVSSTGEASLEDRLLLAGFGEDISVSEVMNTENKMLCYQY